VRGDEGGYLEFLEISLRIIDQSKASGFSSTELSAETECLDCFLGGFVECCETGADIIFREVRLGGVKDVDHLKISLALDWVGTNCLRFRRRLVMNLRVRNVVPSSDWMS